MNLPDGWVLVKVQDIAAPSPRSISIGPFGSDLRADLYVSVGVPVIRGQDITETRELDVSKMPLVSPGTAERLNGAMLKDGDLFFPHRGAIGNVGIIENSDYLMSSSLMKLTCDPSKADPKFVFYYFRGRGRDELLTRASTVGTPGIGQLLRSLRGIPIALPPVNEQQAIAEVLGALDDKIAANAVAMAIIDKLAGALVRRSMGIDSVPLASIALITMGSSPTGDTFNESADGVVFYQGNRDFGFRFPTNRLWTTAPQRMAEPGDTLVSVRAPVGALNIATERTCIGRGLGAIRSTVDAPNVLFHLLKQSPCLWEPFQAEGTVFGSINKNQMAALPVARIVGEVDRLEADVAPLEAELAAFSSASRVLAALRDTLLPQLMSGKLRVEDAEQQVEAVV